MHKVTQAAIAAAVLSLLSYPALSEGIEPPSHTTGFATLAGLPAHPIPPQIMARTRGAWSIRTPIISLPAIFIVDGPPPTGLLSGIGRSGQLVYTSGNKTITIIPTLSGPP